MRFGPAVDGGEALITDKCLEQFDVSRVWRGIEEYNCQLSSIDVNCGESSSSTFLE
jgi:hypothetical protein